MQAADLLPVDDDFDRRCTVQTERAIAARANDLLRVKHAIRAEQRKPGNVRSGLKAPRLCLQITGRNAHKMLCVIEHKAAAEALKIRAEPARLPHSIAFRDYRSQPHCPIKQHDR